MFLSKNLESFKVDNTYIVYHKMYGNLTRMNNSTYDFLMNIEMELLDVANIKRDLKLVQEQEVSLVLNQMEMFMLVKVRLVFMEM